MLGAVDVALHLRERDRPLRQMTVGMENSVLGILPALVGEALLGSTIVFEKAVTVGIARSVDPGESRLDCGPKLDNGLVVAGPLRIESSEHDEEWRGVDAAVVETEGNLAQCGHLAVTHFMQYLSRLRVRGWIVALGLVSGESPQHALRDARINPQHLERR